jgi:hypothetical protein
MPVTVRGDGPSKPTRFSGGFQLATQMFIIFDSKLIMVSVVIGPPQVELDAFSSTHTRRPENPAYLPHPQLR